jgi:hypothetical protein
MAFAACGVNPGDTDSITGFESAGALAGSGDGTHDLVPGYNRQFSKKSALDLVQFGMADTANGDLDQYFAVFGLRNRYIDALKRFFFDRSNFIKNLGFQFVT